MRNADKAVLDVADEVARCYDNPLRFVQVMYPWGEPGPLAQYPGPDVWQAEFLRRLGAQVQARAFDRSQPVAPIRMAVSSGHGTGKSVMAAWLVTWIMATRPQAKGTITANTFTQLRDKTWASIRRWSSLCLAGDWFEVTSERMSHPSFKASWFCSSQSCREENSEAFAGQHAADSTSFYVFDEASAISEKIFEVAEGGLTDGEPMIFLFGNPTRSSGMFHQVCFGAKRARWDAVVVDSRTSAFTNQAQIQEWIEDYGEDSDFVRVRVRGLPPAASDLQFIDQQAVFAAQQRMSEPLVDDPLVCGLDVARGGNDTNVFRFRRGPDARSIEPIRIPGEQTRDSMLLVTKAADVLQREFTGRRVKMLFVDGTGIGGPICDRLKQLGFTNVMEVQFARRAPDRKYANMRSYMWGRMREWLSHGSIDAAAQLEQDLTGPGYMHNPADQVVLEKKDDMKRRGLASPDDGDALALTFAAPVVTRGRRAGKRRPDGPVGTPSDPSGLGWMG